MLKSAVSFMPLNNQLKALKGIWRAEREASNSLVPFENPLSGWGWNMLLLLPQVSICGSIWFLSMATAHESKLFFFGLEGTAAGDWKEVVVGVLRMSWSSIKCVCSVCQKQGNNTMKFLKDFISNSGSSQIRNQDVRSGFVMLYAVWARGGNLQFFICFIFYFCGTGVWT
jgi:hypothetical protein